MILYSDVQQNNHIERIVHLIKKYMLVLAPRQMYISSRDHRWGVLDCDGVSEPADHPLLTPRLRDEVGHPQLTSTEPGQGRSVVPRVHGNS